MGGFATRVVECAAAWASAGYASDSQCSRRVCKKCNLKALVFFGQQLKGEEEKGRRGEEQRARKCPFVVDLNKTISKKHWRSENCLEDFAC